MTVPGADGRLSQRPNHAIRPRMRGVRRVLRIAFPIWAVVSTAWFANSVRTQGVDDTLLQSGERLTVVSGDATLELLPATPRSRAGLIFLCGSGVAAEAYAPLLRPIADEGYPVVIVRLPYRFAFLETHRQEAIDRARNATARHREIAYWVVSGHSLGGALAARIAGNGQTFASALVLIGTTHPREDDLSRLRLPVTKVYASNDGVATAADVQSNKRLLPLQTTWVEIAGGNHSQFGHYGRQLFDGAATISREAQQAETRSALLAALTGASR